MSGLPVTGLNELVLEVLDLDRAVDRYSDVPDPDGNVVELRTWAG